MTILFWVMAVVYIVPMIACCVVTAPGWPNSLLIPPAPPPMPPDTDFSKLPRLIDYIDLK